MNLDPDPDPDPDTINPDPHHWFQQINTFGLIGKIVSQGQNNCIWR